MGFRDKVNDWFWSADSKSVETRGQGSVGSFGGTSPLDGVIPPHSSTFNEQITTQVAMSIDAVYRSGEIIAGHIMQFDLVTKNANGIKNTSGAGFDLIRRPDSNRSLSDFLKRTATNLFYTGNAFWLVRRDLNNDVVDNIEVLQTGLVSIVYSDNGVKTYRIGNKEFSDYNRFSSVQYSVKHLRKNEIEGDAYGVGPVQACMNRIRSIIKLYRYGDAFMDESAIPTGVLSTDLPLTPLELQEFKAEFIKSQTNRTVAVMGKGLKYETTLSNPKDAQYLENQEFAVQTISRITGVPPAWLLAQVGGNSLTYTNMEQVKTEYLQNTLMMYVKQIEDAFTDVTPSGNYVTFDLYGFLRPDTATRIKNNVLELSYKTVNEIREQEGLLPLPGGDVIVSPAPKKSAPTENTDDNE